jgi:hypothetical protein
METAGGIPVNHVVTSLALPVRQEEEEEEEDQTWEIIDFATIVDGC